MDGLKARGMDERIVEWMGRGIDGWVEGQRDRWMN